MRRRGEIPVGRLVDGPRAGELHYPGHRPNASKFVTGPSGSGKSVYVAAHALAELREGHSVLVVDPKGELAQYLSNWAPVCVPDLETNDVLVVRPSTGQLVPLNPLKLALPADQVASVVRRDLEHALGGDELGVRQAAVAWQLLAALAEAGGAIAQISDVIRSEAARAGLAARVRTPRLRQYLIEGLAAEPGLTLAALAARVDHVHEAAAVRAMLSADRVVAGEALLAHRLVIVDLGSPPAGQRGAFRLIQRLLFSVITHALLGRKSRTPKVVLVVDECQAVVDDLADELAVLLQEVRWRGCSVILASQGIEQIRDKLLRETILANVGAWFALSPRAAELKVLADHLPRPTGRRIDPARPDRLLTPREEAANIEARLLALPPRQGLWVDFSGSSSLVQTPNVPIQDIEREVRRLPAAQRDVCKTGTSSSIEELERIAVVPLVEAPAKGKSGRRHSKVELPPC